LGAAAAALLWMYAVVFHGRVLPNYFLSARARSGEALRSLFCLSPAGVGGIDFLDLAERGSGEFLPPEGVGGIDFLDLAERGSGEFPVDFLGDSGSLPVTLKSNFEGLAGTVTADFAGLAGPDDAPSDGIGGIYGGGQITSF